MGKLNIEYPKPQNNQFEITTLGNGPHRGESIVMHLGDDDWVIIDSCMMQDDELPLPLQYLSEIKVFYDSVKMVICTHWHEDHVTGLSRILSECKNAQFFIAAIGEFKDFANYVFKANTIPTLESKAWKEFNECLDKLEMNNKKKPHLLFHDQLFYSKHNNSINMYSLSPSDDMLIKFDSILVNINKESPKEDDIDDIDANMCSLAIAVQYGDLKILVCGDLETNKTEEQKKKIENCSPICENCKESGLCNVVNEGVIYSVYKPYDYVQIPHHGSSTGYCYKLWHEDVKADNSIATTTVYLGSGENLPRKEMLEELKPCVSQLYLTGISAGKPTKKAATNMIKVKGLTEIPGYEDTPGAIISRWNPETCIWENAPFGAALQVTDDVLADYHKYYVEKQA